MPPLTYDDVSHSSNLDYRARLNLINENVAEYGRLWVHAYQPTVWERLMDDAATRQTRRMRSKPYTEGSAVPYSQGTLSGYSSNSSKAVYTPQMSFRTGHNPDLQPAVATMNHPLLAKRFIHKHRIEYLSAIRPDTETSAQTQRMLGTYVTDVPHAQKAGVHIPPVSPSEEGLWFHPDIRLSEQAFRTAQHAHDSMRPRDKVAEMQATRTQRPHSAYPASARQPPSSSQGSRPASALPVTARGAAPAHQQPAHALSRPLSARAPASGSALPARASSRPASAHPFTKHTPAAEQLDTMVRDAVASQPRPALIARPEDAITHRVAWGV